MSRKEKEIAYRKEEEQDHLETLWRLRDEAMWNEEMRPGIEEKIGKGEQLSRSEEMNIHQYGGFGERNKLFAKSSGKNNSVSNDLRISQEGDAQEKEADSIAKKVVSGENSAVSNSESSEINKKEDSGDLMRKSGEGEMQGTENLQSQLSSSKGSGQSLTEDVQQDLGEKMGADLSDVKIHTGSNAHEMSEGPSKWLQRSIDRLQAKMEVSQPEDQSEMQADEVADSFMRGDADHGQNVLSQPAADVSGMGDGEMLGTSEEFDQQLQNSQGQGQKLDEGTRSELEEHTGADLSGVNIHTGDKAHEMSESINAKAFAYGNDIYFKDGNYNPQSEEGKELLAHEVAHVVQGGEGVNLKIQKDDEKNELAKNSLSFQVDISNYVPIPGDANIQNSADFAIGQIFSISTEDAHAYIKLSFVDNTTGYTADQVLTGTSNVKMTSSTYLLILDRIKNVSKTLQTIQNLAAGFHKLYSTRSFSATSANYWNTYISDLRTVYRLFEQLNSADVERVKQKYKFYYKIDLEIDFQATFDWFDHPGYEGKNYRKVRSNGKLLFEGLRLSLLGLPSNAPASDVGDSDEVQNKPTGVILMSPASAVVSVDFEASYSIHVENKKDITYKYKWYILYDSNYPSPKMGHIARPSETDKLSYVWEAPGLNKIFCSVKQFSGETMLTEDIYAASQYVYPNAKAFAKKQEKEELSNYQNSSISIDLLATSVQATQLRMINAQRLISMDKKDVYGAAKVMAAYAEALNSVTVISEYIRSERVKSITPTGGFLPGFEPIWVKQDSAWENNISSDLLNQSDIQNNTQGSQSNNTVTSLGKPIDNFTTTFFNFVAKNYTETFDVEIEPGIASNWTVIKNGWNKDDYTRLFNISYGIGNVTPPMALNKSTVPTWEAVLQNFRIREGFLDDLIALEMMKRNPENKEMQTAAMQLQTSGKMARNIATIYENHPDAIAIPAIFYPDSQQLTLKQGKEGNPAPVQDNYAASGYRVFFYLYKGGF